MPHGPSALSRTFTRSEANAMLPLVRAVAADMARLAHGIADRRERLIAIREHQGNASADVYGAELRQIEEELLHESEQLKGYVAELRQLGVVPTGVLEGRVDFPTELEGRPAFWSWKLGDTEVQLSTPPEADRPPQRPA